ncbi:hypothetical protein ZTR_09884 [Talaromyces verruculosus]|nr:hypothetical protein ZTR_09884 [Talaromyces verruculosus]
MAMGRRSMDTLQAIPDTPAGRPHDHHGGDGRPPTRLRLRLGPPGRSASSSGSPKLNTAVLLLPPSSRDPASPVPSGVSRVQPNPEDVYRHLKITRKRVCQGTAQYKIAGWLPLGSVPDPLMRRYQTETKAAQTARTCILRRLRPR